MIISGEQIGSQEKIFGRYALIEHVYPAEDPSGLELRGLCVSLCVNDPFFGTALSSWGVGLGQAVMVGRSATGCYGYNVIGIQETPMLNRVNLPRTPNYQSAIGVARKPVWILVQHWGHHDNIMATLGTIGTDDRFLFETANTGLVSGATELEARGPRTLSGAATIQLDAAGTGILNLDGTNDGTKIVWVPTFKPQVQDSTWQANQTGIFVLPTAARMVALKYVGAATPDPVVPGTFERTKGFVMCMGLNVR